jgi:hypothetical protein
LPVDDFIAAPANLTDLAPVYLPADECAALADDLGD